MSERPTEADIKWAKNSCGHHPTECLAYGETMTYSCTCDSIARNILTAALEKAEAAYEKLFDQCLRKDADIVDAERSRDEAVKQNEVMREGHADQVHSLNRQIARIMDERDRLQEQVFVSEKRLQEKEDLRLTNIGDLQDQRDAALKAIAASKEVTDEIRDIMAVYREQDARPEGIGTPGGLEHMGDVWRLLSRWDKALAASATNQEGTK